jgi:hypothetical protein
MKYTPTNKLTFWASALLTGVGIFCLCLGWFIASAIFGCAAAINLLAGVRLTKY